MHYKNLLQELKEKFKTWAISKKWEMVLNALLIVTVLKD